MPLLSLITGPLGKLAGIAMLAVSLVTGAGLWLHSHDNAVRAEMQVSADRAIAAAQVASAAREVAALQAQEAAHQATLDRLNIIRKSTHASPPTYGCASSPAVQSMLDGLRNAHPNHPGAAH